MEEVRITFKTAKLAKEKGFKPDIDGLYWEDGNYDSSENALIYEEYPNVVSAPTQSLLQKWLREVHKIDVFCDCIGSGKYYSVIYDNSIKEGNDKVFEQEKETSYEEALEIGLQEGLKLIEIVK